ncbi:alpha/beta hydrolase [Chryseobacterium sp. MP_3.2]|uniref:alpha/beta hydrolase n=1 Tax=Chryseobacterium sp. MP_3.2 TaxID=3071712 RepID=UPI002DFE16A6|nr:pimeloyl-ACP methyl ester carboxylesterase [Chryseobacterium sp. MP_3.2]
MKNLLPIFLFFFLISCKTSISSLAENINQPTRSVAYFDASRNRIIPLAFYYQKGLELKNTPVLIFSHGYGRNNPDSNLHYNNLLGNLAEEGFFVASIQHELPTDDLLPLEGNPQVVRRSNCYRGAENINFVLKELKKKYPLLNYNKVVIAGHSNGGDMSVLFAEQHPELVWKLVTLDQRRYAFPLISQPKIYSLRSSDQPADVGVIPTLDHQKKWGMTIIKLPATIHNDMDDSGTLTQKAEIAKYFRKFLTED